MGQRAEWISSGVIGVVSRNRIGGEGVASTLGGKNASMWFLLSREGVGELGRVGTLSSDLEAIFFSLHRFCGEAFDMKEFQWSCLAFLIALK